MTLWPEVRRLLTLLQESGLKVVRVAEAEGDAQVDVASPREKYRLCFERDSGALKPAKRYYVGGSVRAVSVLSHYGLAGYLMYSVEPPLSLSKKQRLVSLLSRLLQLNT